MRVRVSIGAIAVVAALLAVAPARATLVSAVRPGPHGRLLGMIVPRGPGAGPAREGRAPARSVRVRGTRARLAAAGPQAPPAGITPQCPGDPASPPLVLCWFGGPVLHWSSAYALFWAPAAPPPGVAPFPAGYESVVEGFFGNVAAAAGRSDNVYATDVQYTDGDGPAGPSSGLGGAAVDSNPFPGVLNCAAPSTAFCVTDAQLVQELESQIRVHGWPRGLGPTYFIYLPQGVGVCAGSNGSAPCSYQAFCAYHSAYVVAGGPPVLYAVAPYAAAPGCDSGQRPNANAADAVLDSTSHEQNEMITDPLGNGWLDSSGNENGDKCERIYGQTIGGAPGGRFNQELGGGNYFLQGEFSNVDVHAGDTRPGAGCAFGLANRPPLVGFNVAPSTATAGEEVVFGATATDPDGQVVATSWSFGDGTSSTTGVATSHVYSTPGVYTVSFKAVDDSSLSAVASRMVTVGAAAPSAAFSVSPNPPVVHRGAVFDGSGSTEAGGGVTSWRWSFGDGSAPASGPVVQHSFGAAGPHVVALTVTDAAGASATLTRTVPVSVLESVTVPAGQSRGGVARHGLRVRVVCAEACRVALRLGLGARASAQRTVRLLNRRTLTVRLRTARRLSSRSLTLVAVASDMAARETDRVLRSVTLR